MLSLERLIAALGAAMLVGGWAWSVDHVRPEDQRGALSLAAGGLLVSGAAALASTSRRWRAIADARAHDVAEVRQFLARRDAAGQPAAATRLVRVTGGTWTHRSTCLLTRDKTTRSVRRAATPPQSCPVCRPGEDEASHQRMASIG